MNIGVILLQYCLHCHLYITANRKYFFSIFWKLWCADALEFTSWRNISSVLHTQCNQLQHVVLLEDISPLYYSAINCNMLCYWKTFLLRILTIILSVVHHRSLSVPRRHFIFTMFQSMCIVMMCYSIKYFDALAVKRVKFVQICFMHLISHFTTFFCKWVCDS